MELKTVTYTFTLLTPCFSGTALGRHSTTAEMRIPPIRGHIREWHRALYGAPDCNRVWGSTAGNEGHGSRVALRLVDGRCVGNHHAPILPHDLKKSGKPRPSLADGDSYSIQLQRLVNCTSVDWSHAQAAVRLWLLVGCHGLRSNRAAGSVWPVEPAPPAGLEGLRRELREILHFKWPAQLGSQSGLTETKAREIASDTLQGHSKYFGKSEPRAPSPVKFKVVRLGKEVKLLALARDESLLTGAIALLKPKPLWAGLM